MCHEYAPLLGGKSGCEALISLGALAALRCAELPSALTMTMRIVGVRTFAR